MLYQGHQLDSQHPPSHTTIWRRKNKHDFAFKKKTSKPNKKPLFEDILPNCLIQFYLSITAALSNGNTQHSTGLEKTVKNIHAAGY